MLFARRLSSALADRNFSRPEVDLLVQEADRPYKDKLLTRSLAFAYRQSRFDPDARASIQRYLGLSGEPPPSADQALREMQSGLQARMGGGLTGAELARTEAAVAKVYGPELAAQTLSVALGPVLAQLTAGGVDWIQRHHGQMKGQIDRFQQMLVTYFKDAKLVDTDFDGGIDERDHVVVFDAAGRAQVTPLSNLLRDRVKIGAALGDACYAMAAAKHDFALIKDHTFSAEFWTPRGEGSFALKPGASPSAAVRDIFAHPDLYKFECATAMVIVHYKAILDLLGPEDFDLVCRNLQMGPWVYESTLRNNWSTSGGTQEATAARRAELRGGDYTYFKNWDVSPKAMEEGWQGENVIWLGGDTFYGHPFGIATGREIVDYLNDQRNPGSTRSASMLELRGRVDRELLELDRQPTASAA